MIIHRLAALAFSEQGIFKRMCDERGVVWQSKAVKEQNTVRIRRPKFQWPPEADRRDAPPNSAEIPNSFVYPLGVCGRLEHCLGGHVAKCIFRGNGQATESVRARCSRVGDDAIVFLDLTSEESWLSEMFPGHGSGARVSKFEEIFSPIIVNNVHRSEQRKWERAIGHCDFTDCVQLAYTLKIRISSAGTEILNDLFQLDGD
ncbi:hypothetical protein PFICI_05963 [Pestalotiopsis fici W106-1]|uniref:Uncharacterized protein n=1 Tax=Pestalotiopsis fici (strain W106-1 / CGMCC3.15140) TaxID=1229662 RepID=W3XF81_PESFW|nr:uncharacterized protein PFICI_05963 [Pestalotiopsis fici W106-1]ETS84087.1 hypothetical protein PFICI_05963 [Pestalotiopsis fici W106-1]